MLRMTEQSTIILAPFDAALAADLGEGAPGARVVPPSGMDPVAPGAMWAFIDWLLPEISGLELCRRLRATPSTAGARIFLVLDDNDRDMRGRALKAGADDYLVGPLDAAKVLERIGASAATAGPPRSLLGNGSLQLDRDAYQVRAAGRPVRLRGSEFELLAYLLENPDRVLSRRELIRAVKGENQVEERTVDAWIKRLRQALAGTGVPLPIRTVRELGYVYDSF